jgi:hypothetical protein
MKFSLLVLALLVVSINAFGWLKPISTFRSKALFRVSSRDNNGDKEVIDIETTTKKYGLEVGLWKSMTNKDGSSIKPGDLLKKYGAAYLLTSISLAIVSYAICYFLVRAGVDVPTLLKKINIEVTTTASNVGTAGIAYVIHKAASPIRFPPTVALTPVVAEILGKRGEKEVTEGSE